MVALSKIVNEAHSNRLEDKVLEMDLLRLIEFHEFVRDHLRNFIEDERSYLDDLTCKCGLDV
jgi:hypothetical protein